MTSKPEQLDPAGVAPTTALARADRSHLLPSLVAAPGDIRENMKMFREFVRENMEEGEDFHIIGKGDKVRKVLGKSGAEKMLTFHGFGFECILDEKQSVADWDKPFFRFVYHTRVFDRATGATVAAGMVGECHSREGKYAFRWAFPSECSDEEKARAVATREIETRRGRTTKYLIPAQPHEIVGLTNTLQKMAQKRSIVAGALAACRASGAFTQDVEEDGYFAPPAAAVKGGSRSDDASDAEWTSGGEDDAPRPKASAPGFPNDPRPPATMPGAAPAASPAAPVQQELTPVSMPGGEPEEPEAPAAAAEESPYADGRPLSQDDVAEIRTVLGDAGLKGNDLHQYLIKQKGIKAFVQNESGAFDWNPALTRGLLRWIVDEIEAGRVPKVTPEKK